MAHTSTAHTSGDAAPQGTADWSGSVSCLEPDPIANGSCEPKLVSY
jgi:hypothetical protein